MGIAIVSHVKYVDPLTPRPPLPGVPGRGGENTQGDHGNHGHFLLCKLSGVPEILAFSFEVGGLSRVNNAKRSASSCADT